MSSNADRLSPCPSCGQPCEMIMSAPRIGVLQDPAAKKAALRKRSHDHTIREMKKEPEKHGFQAADRRPWNIRSHSKPSS